MRIGWTKTKKHVLGRVDRCVIDLHQHHLQCAMLRARLSLACGQWSVQFAPRARRARAMAALNGASRNKIRFYNITPAPGACPW